MNLIWILNPTSPQKKDWNLFTRRNIPPKETAKKDYSKTKKCRVTYFAFFATQSLAKFGDKVGAELQNNSINWIHPPPRMQSSPPGWHYIFWFGNPKLKLLFVTVTGWGVESDREDHFTSAPKEFQPFGAQVSRWTEPKKGKSPLVMSISPKRNYIQLDCCWKTSCIGISWDFYAYIIHINIYNYIHIHILYIYIFNPSTEKKGGTNSPCQLSLGRLSWINSNSLLPTFSPWYQSQEAANVSTRFDPWNDLHPWHVIIRGMIPHHISRFGLAQKKSGETKHGK